VYESGVFGKQNSFVSCRGKRRTKFFPNASGIQTELEIGPPMKMFRGDALLQILINVF
jgi:hypothetical protein